jgi:HD-GYP domain-containing protein (c-di-GMP phosphodiesterase class II)
LRRCSGSHFDPQVVTAIERALLVLRAREGLSGSSFPR